MKEIEINTLKDFVGKITKRTIHPRKILYRGQSEDLPLLPKIVRNPILVKSEVNNIEKEMLKQFKLKATPFLEYKPLTDWEWLSIAQHHGLKTRLLDWTENALAALWFCVEKKPLDLREFGVVWELDTILFDILVVTDSDKHPFEIEYTKILIPPNITRRIIAQSGLFTVHKLVDKKKLCVPLEKNKKYIDSLTKIKIPCSKFDEIKKDLNQCGINSASMFPGLDGICSHLNEILSSKEKIRRLLNYVNSMMPNKDIKP
jgi:hypothetical protein